MTDESEPDLDRRIARRASDLRAARGLTLEALAESSPPAVLLERLAVGLNVPLASLFEAPRTTAQPVARRADQPRWRDPASGYVRRNVSPGGFPSPFQIVEVAFPRGARVASDTGARDPRVHQQVWVLEGAINVTVGED